MEEVLIQDGPDRYRKRAVEFEDWIIRAKPHSWYTYHYGEHLFDDRATIYAKTIAWNYACKGRIYIFMKRDLENPKNFFFLAQKASRIFPHLTPRDKRE